MGFFGVDELIRKINDAIINLRGAKMNPQPFKPIWLELELNPKYKGRQPWGRRPLTMIDKFIVHQELGEGNTRAVHRYHISENSHLKRGGAPKIAYHFTIERDGTVYQVNELRDITWHTAGQNMVGVGIMLVGDFTGPTHQGKRSPTERQLNSLSNLLDYLTVELNLTNVIHKLVYGHCDFGKKNCPGNEVMDFLRNGYRRKRGTVV